jgi:H+/Cl- antiporter ClcA
MVKLDSNFFIKTVLPRAINTAIWGAISYLIVYYLPQMLLSSDMVPMDFSASLFDYGLITVFFVVMGQLFSGTIIGCGFGIAKALTIMFFFFSVADGGLFSVTLPINDVVVNLTFDLSVILVMIVSVNLFDIAKNLLEAISILTDQTTQINWKRK